MKSIIALIIVIGIIAGVLYYTNNTANHAIDLTPAQADTSAAERFLGKPTLIVFAGTYCPSCQTKMPILEEEIHKAYGEDINVFVNVIDGKGGARFTQDIPQDFDPTLNYGTLTGKECGYVPSWVLLDANGTTIESACGGEKEVDSIKTTLDTLLAT